MKKKKSRFPYREGFTPKIIREINKLDISEGEKQKLKNQLLNPKKT